MGAGCASRTECVDAGEPIPQRTARLADERMPWLHGVFRDDLVGAASALLVTELVTIIRRRGDDGGNLLHRPARAPIALREQAAEFVHGVDRIETNRQRVCADPSA